MGFKTYGIEPASNLARASEDIGINKVYKNFFGLDFAVTHKEELGDIDLIMANNVAAHVPDIHDFFAGVAQLMSSNTILSIENPGLDTIMKSIIHIYQQQLC
jgi:predicted TPR repeat methyltransferase